MSKTKNDTSKPDADEKEITTKEFVSIWQSAASPAEVEAKTGIRAAIAAARASALRKKGVNLKYFTPGRKKEIDVAALNKLIEAMGGAPAAGKPPKKTATKAEDPDETIARHEAAESQKREMLRRLLGQK